MPPPPMHPIKWTAQAHVAAIVMSVGSPWQIHLYGRVQLLPYQLTVVETSYCVTNSDW
jgi:hypothetical protein